jgi:acetyl esterase/lipase
VTPYPLEVPNNVELIRDVPFGSVEESPLLLDLALPKERESKAAPAYVYMHGGAWMSGNKEDGVPAICYYAARGIAGASVGYRLSQEARFPAQIEDCLCAVRFLRAHAGEYCLDPDRIGAMGASSGGQLAILLGLVGGSNRFAAQGGWEDFSSQVSAVCDLFGVSDFLKMPRKQPPETLGATARFLGGTIEEMQERYVEASPVNYVHAGAPPFLIIHGDADPVVPLQQSELLHEALQRAGADSVLHIVKGAGHGSANVITPEVRDAILAFFKRTLV